MKILIIGASSYVGSRLYYDLNKKFELIGTYQNNKLSEQFIHLDITNPKYIDAVVRKHKPNAIIHVAANAKPSWCEENPLLAITLNQESTKNIVKSANMVGARLILISSFAAINPTNIYGKTKQKSEEYAKQTKKGFVIIRPSLVIGLSPNSINNHSFNRILRNLYQKKEDFYDTSWKFQPTYIGHISEVIAGVLERNIVNEVLPVAVKQLKSKYNIASDIFSNFNVKTVPINNHDKTHLEKDSLEKLKYLHLPYYTYKEVINKIIVEINDKDLFNRSKLFNQTFIDH